MRDLIKNADGSITTDKDAINFLKFYTQIGKGIKNINEGLSSLGVKDANEISSAISSLVALRVGNVDNSISFYETLLEINE